jgi:CheY-like chemotaxis protein
MNGLDATRHIKALAPKEFPVIIALTASSFEDERSQILAAGCDGFLRKPFEEDELLALMKEHLALEYLYDDDDGGAEHPSMPAARKQLASLSADLRTSLEQALIRLDPLAVSDAIAKLPADTLAEGLVAMASEFQYGRMLQLIRESRPVNKA